MSRRRTAVLVTGIGLLLTSALLAAAPAALADDSSTQGVGIQAQVTQAPSTNGTTNTSTTSGGGRTGSPSGSGSGSTASQAPFDSQVLGAGGAVAMPAPSSSAAVATGMLAVSGLRVVFTPSIDPRAGDLHVEATVRNLSDQVMDVGTQYSATTAFGMVLDRAAPTSISRLAPGELRVVEADLTGMGQWGVVVAHLTLRPPAQVDGADVGPITRDRWVVLPPWFALGIGAVLVAGGLVWWRAGRVAPLVGVGAVG